MLDFLVGNDALSAIVAFVLVLIPAVLIHELGHFLRGKIGRDHHPRIWHRYAAAHGQAVHAWRNGLHAELAAARRALCVRSAKIWSRQMGDEATERRPPGSGAARRWQNHVGQRSEATAAYLLLGGRRNGELPLAFVLFVVIALMGIPEVTGGVVGASKSSRTLFWCRIRLAARRHHRDDQR